jgi:microtubule-associated protein-like 6
MTNVLSALKAMEKKPAPSIAEVEKKTNELFTKMDTNQDNSISIQEFKTFLKTDKQILQCLLSYGLATSDDIGHVFGVDSNGVPDLDPDLDAEVKSMQLNDVKKEKRDAIKEGIDFKPAGDFDANIDEGDQFMATKPWLGTVNNTVPTGWKPSKNDKAMPDAQLDLEYVYGYRCHDSRSNLRYLNSGKIVYHTAGVGIVMDPESNTQQHFMGHNDDILCMALHPDGKTVATG